MTIYKKTKTLEDGSVLYQCSKCKEFKPYDEFNKEKRSMNGIQSSCKQCRRDFRVENRDSINERAREVYRSKDQTERIKRDTERRRKRAAEIGYGRERFHQDARGYLRDSGLKFKECFSCKNKGKLELHHPSYASRSDWSIVVPLCRDCHRGVHSGRIPCPEPINLVEIAPGYKKSRRSWQKK